MTRIQDEWLLSTEPGLSADSFITLGAAAHGPGAPPFPFSTHERGSTWGPTPITSAHAPLRIVLGDRVHVEAVRVGFERVPGRDARTAWAPREARRGSPRRRSRGARSRRRPSSRPECLLRTPDGRAGKTELPPRRRRRRRRDASSECLPEQHAPDTDAKVMHRSRQRRTIDANLLPSVRTSGILRSSRK